MKNSAYIPIVLVVLSLAVGCGAKAPPTLVPTLPPLDQKSEVQLTNEALESEIQLTNEAVMATNEMIETLIAATETADTVSTWTPEPTHTPQPTNTLVVVEQAQASPTWTPVSVNTPVPTDMNALPSSKSIDDMGHVTDPPFEAYLRDNYSSIGGQSLEIEDFMIIQDDHPYRPFRTVSIDITSDSRETFKLQPRAVAMEYAERLWKDVKTYFDDQSCSLYVQHGFYTDDASWASIAYDNEWVHMGDEYVSRLGGWSISLYVVRGIKYQDASLGEKLAVNVYER